MSKPFPSIARWTIPLILPLLTLAVLSEYSGWATSAVAQQQTPAVTYVVRIYYESIEDINRLAEYDVWEYNNLKERYVLAAVDRPGYDRLLASGWRLALDEEATSLLRRPETTDEVFDQYRTVDALYADLAKAAAAYPNLTELVDYGDSYCKLSGGCTTLGGDTQPGHDLLAIRVSNETISGTSTVSATEIVSGTKPIFFLMANLHAREITTPELAMRLLDWLLQGYDQDAQLTWLVDWHEIWIVPTANPDGHWLVELGENSPYDGAPFDQRKNANRSNGCLTWPPIAAWQYGIDLNRNHSFFWSGLGSGLLPCSQTYRGPSAASEPEVAQLQGLLQSLFADQRGPDPEDSAPLDTRGLFITLHSYSQLVLWPWGYTFDPAPNKAELQFIGDKLATYNDYQSCQPTSCLYPASGTSDDWVYGELGVPAFTFEVGRQFMPPYAEIENEQWPRNRPALLYAAQIARAPYRLAQGPDALDLSVVMSTPEALTLTAVIDDRQNGNQSVATADFSIDAPYWVSGTLTYPMSAVDGAFDSPSEAVTALFDSSLLSSGRHTLFLRGQDSSGNWGPVTARYFYPGQTIVYFLPLIRQN